MQDERLHFLFVVIRRGGPSARLKNKKMKKSLFLIAFFATMYSGFASEPGFTYNTTYTTSNGQTIYIFATSSYARVVAPIDNDGVYTYTLTGGYSSWSKTKPTGHLVIPGSVTYNGNSVPVTEIGNYAFTECTGLLSVTIPGSVTEIGNGAFNGCTGLTSVSIPNSVTTIGNNAFNGCTGLTSVSIPNSVTSFGQNIFSGCSNLNMPVYTDSVFLFLPFSYSGAYAIPNGIKAIVSSAFGDRNSLSEITIPSTVTYIESGTFTYCDSLATVNYNVENLYTTWPGPFAYNQSISAFNFGSGVRRIPAGLCSDLTNIASVTLPNSIEYIGEYAFEGTGIRSVEIPVSVDTIDYGAFANDSMSVYYNGTLQQWCDIEIGFVAFYQYEGAGYDLYMQGELLRDLVIPIDITTLEHKSFVGCNLSSVVIPNHVTSIGEGSFSSCINLETVSIGNGLTTIAESAFEDCSAMTSLTLGSSITSIQYGAFKRCSSLAEITSFNPTAPTVSNNSFYGVPNTIPVNVPCGSTPSYLSRWSYFSNFVEMGENAFETYSADETMGTVQILTAPTCTAPTAVIFANANSGYRFDRWSDGNTDNPRTLTVVSDTTIIGFFASENAVDLTDEDAVSVASSYNVITVGGAVGECIRLFDATGRQLGVCDKAVDRQSFTVPESGVYFVQVGNRPACKVVIIR